MATTSRRDDEGAFLAYGVLAAEALDEAREGLATLGDRAPELWRFDDLVLALEWCCNPADPRDPRDHQGALAFHRTTVALGTAVPLLPFRFSSFFAGPGDTRAFVEEHREALHRQLRRVTGRVELTVRLLGLGEVSTAAPSDGSDAPQSGREYLARRRLQIHRREELRRRLEAEAERYRRALAPTAVDHAVSFDDEGGAFGSSTAACHLLVDRRTLPFQTQAFRWLRTATPRGLRAGLTGPWPPRRFATPPPLSGPGLQGSGSQCGLDSIQSSPQCGERGTETAGSRALTGVYEGLHEATKRARDLL